jgi:hypothetical protein
MPPHLRKPVARLAAVALAVLVAALAFRWWDRYMEDRADRSVNASRSAASGSTMSL